MNSLRHGLTSQQIVLPGEDAEEYEALRADAFKIYKPANSTETLLVEELSASSWRLMRVRAQETAIIHKLLGDKAGSRGAFAALFVEKPKEIARLTRYITSIERAYYRALNKLEKVQEEREKAEQAEAVRQAWAKSVREQQQQSGFVSQNNAAESPPLSPSPKPMPNAPIPRLRS
jgi:hypothetical protein